MVNLDDGSGLRSEGSCANSSIERIGPQGMSCSLKQRHAFELVLGGGPSLDGREYFLSPVRADLTWIRIPPSTLAAETQGSIRGRRELDLTRTSSNAWPLLNEHDIPCGPILSMEELAHEPSAAQNRNHRRG